jgi:1-phosphofructokinase
MIVTRTPNPSLDRTLFLDTFTRGAVNRCIATLVEPSGKGINVALALHSHGVPALALLPSGGPAGEQLVQLLVTDGLPYPHGDDHRHHPYQCLNDRGGRYQQQDQ